MSRLLLDKVTKRYSGGVLALDGVSLEVASGQLVVVVGPSGSGKTTLLRTVAGLVEPSSGSVTIGDRVVDGLSPRERDVAFVFQNATLYPHLNVRENLAFPLRRRGYPRARIRSRVEAMSALLGVESLLGRRPHALSGGERQRIALGRALIREPRVLLLDEPLASLDAARRWQMRSEISRLHREFRPSTIYVTHDQEHAMPLADRLIVLNDGRVQQAGTPAELYRDPVNDFVARFLGSPPTNLLEGKIEADGSSWCFRVGNARLALAASCSQVAGECAGRSLLLGVRPQAVTAGAGDVEIRDDVLEASIVERFALGERTFLACLTVDGQRVVATWTAEAERTAPRVSLSVDMSRVSMFDPRRGGRNVARRAP